MSRTLVILAIYFGALAVLSLLTISTATADTPAQPSPSAKAQPQPRLGLPAKPRVTISVEQPRNAAAPVGDIVGQWSTARSSDEAFAMQLNSDGSFILIFVRRGEQSFSTGKFTLSGSQLTLTTSDGGEFTGKVSNLTLLGFEFTPQGGAATTKLSFQRAT